MEYGTIDSLVDLQEFELASEFDQYLAKKIDY